MENDKSTKIHLSEGECLVLKREPLSSIMGKKEMGKTNDLIKSRDFQTDLSNIAEIEISHLNDLLELADLFLKYEKELKKRIEKINRHFAL